MRGNLNRRPIGKCSQCGGVVSIPTIWWSVSRPVAQCESCGAVLDETWNLPVVPTRPLRGPRGRAPYDREVWCGIRVVQPRFSRTGTQTFRTSCQ